MPLNPHADRTGESQRILARMAQETDPAGRVGRLPERRDDPIEYWGTRIGRSIGLVMTIGLIVWLVVTIAGSQ